jgi:hypothetical protein
MTNRTAYGIRSPIGPVNDLSEEDRATHRKWARALSMAYSAGIIALLAILFVTHHYRDVETARHGQTVGFHALPTEISHPFG